MITYSRLGDVEYWGQLGNQLFEIASTYGIAKRNGQDCIFPRWKYSQWFPNVPIGTVGNFPIYREGNDYSFREINLNGDTDLVGYFQSYKYFDFCREEILNLFESNIELDTPPTKVAIHVRRGDYLSKSNFHTNLPIEYYREAMSYFPNERFTIFSDDIRWCRDNFSKEHFFVEPISDVIDLIFMSRHENQIIANSSYSWWAAYLNKNPNKKVIAPKKWWMTIPSEDVCPPDWIRI